MLLEKKRLSVEDLEAQMALELPDREMMLVTVIITNTLNDLDVLNDLTIDVTVRDIQVALAVCAVISDVNAILVDDVGASVATLTCAIQQSGRGNSPG